MTTFFFKKKYVKEYTKNSGIDCFDQRDFPSDRRSASKIVSDHRPIWVIFETSQPDDD